MDELLFSRKYYVRKLQKNDIDQIYNLCSKNHLYYQYCSPYVTRKSIESDMMVFQTMLILRISIMLDILRMRS